MIVYGLLELLFQTIVAFVAPQGAPAIESVGLLIVIVVNCGQL